MILATSLALASLKGEALITDVSRRAFDYFWNESKAPHYQALDRARNSKSLAPHDRTPASIAAVGYALAACAIGADRGWITRRRALERARAIASATLAHAPSHRGWFYHFYDPKTMERMWNCEVSTIDTSLYLNGLMVAEGYFRDAKLKTTADRTYARVDWRYMLTDDGAKPGSLFFTMGYSPENGFIGSRWDDYNELMHLYLAAYALWPEMPKDSWDKWVRTPVTYKGLEFFRGGPLFLHQMSQGFYDFKGRRDRLGYDYWVGSRNATLGQILYCTENPLKYKGYGKDIWGLSACDVPDGYGAQGTPPDVRDNGTLAPVSATASVLFTPKESIAATEAFVREFPESYGRYGFTTGFCPNQNWVSPDVIGIDIGQAMLNIENYQNGGPHRWMMRQPRVARALRKVGLLRTQEGRFTARKLRVEK